MAKTEITKILFRRGEEKHRRSLFTYGGLDNGEPGWTSVTEKAASIHLTSYGINPNFPDLSKTTYTGDLTMDDNGHGLRPPGNPPERPSGQNAECGVAGSEPKGLCDLWIGGGKSEQDDIYIGGQSAEYYNQMRFVSLSGTDLNHPKPYIQGNLTVGISGTPYNFHQYGNVEVGVPGEGYNVLFQSDLGSASIAAGGQYLLWDQACGILDVHSTTALKIPVGTTDERPGTDWACASATGQIRYNTTQKKFEGMGAGDVWTSLGGVMSTDRKTFISVERQIANASDCGSPQTPADHNGYDHTITFVTSCHETANFGMGTLGIWNSHPDYTGGGTEGAQLNLGFAGGGPLGGDDKIRSTTGDNNYPLSSWHIDVLKDTAPMTYGHGVDAQLLRFGGGQEWVDGGLTLTMDTSGNARFAGDVIAFSSSDISLKKNIILIDQPLEKLYKIRGVEFDWKPDEQQLHKGHDVGVIAQEVETVLPEIVSIRNDGTKAVKYEKLIPLLIESVKELGDKVESLEEQLRQLKD